MKVMEINITALVFGFHFICFRMVSIMVSVKMSGAR